SVVVDVVARRLLHAATDALSNPIVVVRTEQVPVALEQLLRQGAHLLRSETRIDAQILERAVEPVDMFLHLEQPVVEAARHIEAAITVDPARIAKRYPHLALRNEASIEPGNSFVAARAHVSTLSCGMALSLIVGV